MTGRKATTKAIEDALQTFAERGFDVASIARRYALHSDSLEIGLNAIYKEYIASKIEQDAIPQKSDVEALLSPIANQAEKLRARLNDLPQLLAQNLDYQADQETELLLDRLATDLVLLQEFAEQTTANWGMPKRGEDYNTLLLLRLAQLWKLLTGRGAGNSSSWSNSVRSGEFLSFVKDAAELLAIDSGDLDDRFARLKSKHPDIFK